MMNEEKKTKSIQKKFDLQDWFIDYAVRIIHVSEQLPETKAGKYISYQILRSSTSPAANYGEAQSAESKADFIHKLKIFLFFKELRENEVWLKIILSAKLIKPSTKLSPLLQETHELISILFKSIDTAKKKHA